MEQRPTDNIITMRDFAACNNTKASNGCTSFEMNMRKHIINSYRANSCFRWLKGEK